MDKKQLINAIMSLCDENEALKAQIEKTKIAKAAVDGVGELSLADRMAGLTAICIDYGKKSMWDSIIDDWYIRNHSICHTKDDMNNVLSFDAWLNTLTYDMIRNSYYNNEGKVLFEMIKQYSLIHIIEFFKDQLRDIYDKKYNELKMQAVRNAKGQNNDDDDNA